MIYFYKVILTKAFDQLQVIYYHRQVGQSLFSALSSDQQNGEETENYVIQGITIPLTTISVKLPSFWTDSPEVWFI